MERKKTFPVVSSMQNELHLSRRGFTLLELIVVLLLVALVSAMVVVRWSGLHRGPAMESAVSQLEFLDAHMRRYAQMRRQQCSMSIDLSSNLVRKQYHAASNKNPRWESLGANIRILDVDGPSVFKQGNKVEIVYQADGSTRSFGLELSGPGEQRAYLLVAGVSGQVTRFDESVKYKNAQRLLKKE